MDVKDRMKRYREKLKQNDRQWEEHKEKNRQRMLIYRQKLKKNPKSTIKKVITTEQRKKNKERMRRYRAKKKYLADHPEASSLPCRTKQSFHKGGRLDNKQNVTKESYGKRLSSKLESKASQMKQDHTPATDESDLHAKVVNFYNEDFISYQAPGKQNLIPVTVDNNTILMPKRYMIMSVGESYELYCSEVDVADDRVERSVFSQLRPQNVVAVSDTRHNNCVCHLHANFINICLALNKIDGFPFTHEQLLSKICCDVANEYCMAGKCCKCGVNVNNVLPLMFDYEKSICWKKWAINSENGRVEETELNSSASEAIAELQAQLSNFKMHFYVNNVQSEHFRLLKETIHQGEAVIQIDFAENYSIIMPDDELLSTDFSNQQVTVFTSYIWMQHETQSIAIISNDLSHDRYSVYNFLKTIFDFLSSKKSGTLNNFHIFSDGCNERFKNKFLLSSLIMLQAIYNVKITWSFFATSRDKGAVDSIAAAVKRCVWTQILSRQITITNAKDFANCAINKLRNIKIFYKNKESITVTRIQLRPIWDQSCLSEIADLKLINFAEVEQNSIICRFTFKSTECFITIYNNYIENK